MSSPSHEGAHREPEEEDQLERASAPRQDRHRRDGGRRRRAWALADLAGRADAEVRGPKKLWALGLGVVNSAGVLPAAYLLVGRGTRMA